MDNLLSDKSVPDMRREAEERMEANERKGL